MNIRRFAAGLCAALFIATLAAPAIAGKNRSGGGNQDARGMAYRQQYRDGSSLQGDSSATRARNRMRSETGAPARKRLRDGSCWQRLGPAPVAPAE